MKSLFYFSKLTLLSFCLLSNTIIFSQRPQSFYKFTVTGTVVDQETKQPLEYATITFRNELRPEMLQGGITTEGGKFSIEVFPGKYNISTEYISFKTITQKEVMVQSNKDLGTINLEIEASSLDEVECSRSAWSI